MPGFVIERTVPSAGEDLRQVAGQPNDVPRSHGPPIAGSAVAAIVDPMTGEP